MDTIRELNTEARLRGNKKIYFSFVFLSKSIYERSIRRGRVTMSVNVRVQASYSVIAIHRLEKFVHV